MSAPRSALSQYERKTVPLPEMSIDALNAEEAELLARRADRLAAVRAEKARRGVKPANEDAQTVASGKCVEEQKQSRELDCQSKTGGASVAEREPNALLAVMSIDELNAEALRLAAASDDCLIEIWSEIAGRGDAAVKAGRKGFWVDPDLQTEAKLAKLRAAHARLTKKDPPRYHSLGENGQSNKGWHTSTVVRRGSEVAYRRGFMQGAVFARRFNHLVTPQQLDSWDSAVSAWRRNLWQERDKQDCLAYGGWNPPPEHPGERKRGR